MNITDEHHQIARASPINPLMSKYFSRSLTGVTNSTEVFSRKFSSTLH